MSGHQKWVVAVVIAASLLAGRAMAGEANKSLFRWVDEKGQVHYGDKVPPKDSKQGRAAINRNGTVTKVIPRELSGAELEQEQARLAAEKITEEAHQQRLTYDRYLVQSFAGVADLQAAREERLGALDARISLAEASVIENEKVLADLRSRVTGKTMDASLKKQIETFEGSLIDNLQAARKLRDERAATEIKFASDIDRFKGLRAGTIKQGE